VDFIRESFGNHRFIHRRKCSVASMARAPLPPCPHASTRKGKPERELALPELLRVHQATCTQSVSEWRPPFCRMALQQSRDALWNASRAGRVARPTWPPCPASAAERPCSPGHEDPWLTWRGALARAPPPAAWPRRRCSSDCRWRARAQPLSKSARRLSHGAVRPRVKSWAA
jgi:hypothetical protein